MDQTNQSEAASSGFEKAAGAQPGAGDGPIVADSVQVYSRNIKGTFRTIKWSAIWILLGLYYVAPWLRWDRGPNAPGQALLVDMPGRRAYFFDIEIWPQEVYYLVGILIIAAVGLFLATALAGRIWCGFFCVQTVWTDLFMWVERHIEGDRNARIRLDKGPLTFSKAFKKITKHIAWMLISLATGGAWIMYFKDAPTFTVEFFTGTASYNLYGFTLLFAGTTYILAGWAREAVCIYMCPWPRFQSAMFDEHSLIVTYEEWRGEPRGKSRRDADFTGRGHCVDCTMCVQVCPTGVDIRQGQQMACIGCALCVDACNSIMDRFNLPRGLITYDSTANQVARSKDQATKFLPLRPRTIIYAAVMLIAAAVMLFSLVSRERLEINVLRDRAPLFVRLSDGGIRNGYTFKVLNMERLAKTYTLALDGIDGATLAVIGIVKEGATSATLPVKPDTVGTFRVFVKAPRRSLPEKSMDMNFLLTDQKTGKVYPHETVFAGPGR